MNPDILRKAADLALLHQLKKTAAIMPYLEHGVGAARKVIGDVIPGAFRHAGKGVEEALTMAGQQPGWIARGAGKVVQYTPHALGLYGLGKLVQPHVEPYVRAKMMELQARMAATQPYYDPESGRYM